MSMFTSGYKALRYEFNLSFDDAWGDTMSWWFAIAENLYHADPALVPSSWEYRDSPLHDGVDADQFPDAEIADLLADGAVTLADLLAFGRVLTRYATILKTAGKDY